MPILASNRKEPHNNMASHKDTIKQQGKPNLRHNTSYRRRLLVLNGLGEKIQS
jgi:hypothetical protein